MNIVKLKNNKEYSISVFIEPICEPYKLASGSTLSVESNFEEPEFEMVDSFAFVIYVESFYKIYTDGVLTDEYIL